MSRRLVTVVLVSGLSFSVYLFTGGTVPEQVAFAADAGISPPNRNCTCPVRLDPEYAEGAGLSIYQRLLFPCTVRVMADGGRDVQLPPMPLGRVRDALDVVSWDDCTLAASTVGVRNLWGTKNPFTLTGVVKPWCRARLPALPCLLTDGGLPGDRNIGPCAGRAAPATCERVSSGVIYLGDDPEAL